MPPGLGWPAAPAPAGLASPTLPRPPPQLFQVTVITNHDNQCDPSGRLITGLLSLSSSHNAGFVQGGGPHPGHLHSFLLV